MNHDVSIDDILLAVQRITHIGVRDIKGRGQTSDVRDARLLAYFVASQCYGHSFGSIAHAIGRDTTTVADTVRRLCTYTRFILELVDQIEEEAAAIARVRRSGQVNSPIYAAAETA